MREVTNSSVRVAWHVPSEPNGIIQGYRMYFMQKNFTDVRTVRQPRERMESQLTGLRPYTRYKIWLKAFTWKNEGSPSQPFDSAHWQCSTNAAFCGVPLSSTGVGTAEMTPFMLMLRFL